MDIVLTKNYKKYLFLIPLLFFIIDYLLISNHLTVYFDKVFFELLRLQSNILLIQFFKIITFFGSFYCYLIIIVVTIIYKYQKGIVYGINCLAIHGINRLVKNIFCRSRPDVINHLIKETGYSFPSGHAMSSFLLFGTLILELENTKCTYRRLMQGLLIILILLIGISRVYLGVHYLSDVIGGYLLSLTYILFIKYNTSLFTYGR